MPEVRKSGIKQVAPEIKLRSTRCFLMELPDASTTRDEAILPITTGLKFILGFADALRDSRSKGRVCFIFYT